MSSLTVQKKVYIPYMCDHAQALSAALRALGTDSECLPPPDEETLAIGRELCLGRECLPLFVVVGDILRRARQPDFDPAQSAYFMPTTCGPCRFGQYRTMLRLLLDEAGLQELEILSADADNGYQGMSDDPLRFRLLAWQGIVAVDLLLKLRHDHRPYEQIKGETDRFYAACLDRLVAAIEAGGGRRTRAALSRAAEQFAGIGLDRSRRRPVIGIVGEIYVRNNTFTSQDIARQVEEMGGQVWVAPMMEWIYFSVWSTRERARLTGRWLEWLKALGIEWVQQHVERRVLKPVQHMLQFPHEPAMAALMDSARPYYHPLLGTEAVLSIGKAVDYAHHGLCGVLNVLPFTCMPSLVVTGVAQSIRAANGHIPWLDVIYDAQGGTNVNTRMEAFMYQAEQYMAVR
ncbi:MAG: hypothetical protein JXA89_02845 [Anaerolineae bacterium]|nr:hypothetical protein [Anaerolineae bacterium]